MLCSHSNVLSSSSGSRAEGSVTEYAKRDVVAIGYCYWFGWSALAVWLVCCVAVWLVCCVAVWLVSCVAVWQMEMQYDQNHGREAQPAPNGQHHATRHLHVGSQPPSGMGVAKQKRTSNLHTLFRVRSGFYKDSTRIL